MFKDASVFCTVDKDSYEVKKLSITSDIQSEIINIFNTGYISLMDNGKDFLKFDGRYSAGKNEIQYIENFSLPDNIRAAIEEPISTDELTAKNIDDSEINSIFISNESEEKGIIVFQNFQKDQIITNRGINIFLDKKIFKKLESQALNIKNEIHCVYKNNNLYFSSFWQARQIFDLADYYKEATDEDLTSFATRDEFYLQNMHEFVEDADSWVRRKVALIQDAGIVDKYKPKEIVSIAKEHDVEIELRDDKILIPSNKRELKIMLKFLDEDIYKGPLTDDTFETNSKRQFA